MARHTIRTPEVRARFLEALAETGNVTSSCEWVGLGRASLYEWRAQDPEFSDAWDDALALGVCALEDKALDFAMAGNDRLIMFLLQARKPDVYQSRATVELNHNHTIHLRRTPLDDLRTELATLVGLSPPTIEHDPADPVVVPFPPKPL